MKYKIKTNKTVKPFVLFHNNVIKDVNYELELLTGFIKEEFIGKSLKDISEMLKINDCFNIAGLGKSTSCYIFTKKCEPREVSISCNSSESENIYFFKEKFNSRVEEKNMYFEQLCRDNHIGAAIYSYPDLVLLKANEKVIENHYVYNNKEDAIGKTLKELVEEKKWSMAESHILNAANSCSSYYVNELECEHEFKGFKYYDKSVVPIYVSGQLKYIVETLTDVTERVQQRKLNEEKTEQLEVIIKNISDGVFICNNEGKTVIANNNLRKGRQGLKEIQDTFLYHKYMDMSGNEITYENLPIKRALRGEIVKNELMTVTTNDDINIIRCNATPIYDKNGNIVFGAATFTDLTELYNKNNIIEKQKIELESIIENISEGVCVLDKNYNITMSSRSLRKFINISDFKRVSDMFENIRYYDLKGNPIPYNGNINGKIFKGEFLNDLRVIAYKDDETYHISLYGRPIFDKDCNVEKAVISIRDITEQIEKDNLIKKQNDILNAILENMSEELLILDEKGHYKKVNKAFRNLYSISDSEQVNLETILKKFKFYDMDGNIIAPENWPSKRIFRGEKLLQMRKVLEDKSGNKFHTEVSGSPIYDNDGNFIAGVLVMRDISERLKNEENKLMKAQYDLISRTIENLQFKFILISYPDIKIKYMNNQVLDLVKEFAQVESLDSCIGKSAYEVFRFNQNEKSEMDLKLKELANNNESSFILNKSNIIEGKEKHFKIIHQPLFNSKNEITEIALIGIDITDEIQAKNKMEEAYKMQSEIFINVSHELKTPLNVIYSSVQMMEMYLKNESIEEYRDNISRNIKIIKQNCYRFIRLINNILDTSKVKSGFLELNLSNENIVEVIENIVQSVTEYSYGKGINIIFDTDTEEKIIACDANKIERILLNLISNAVKYSDKGSNIYINVSDKNDVVEITVRDTGIGIDKKDIDGIFNPFYQVDKSLSRNVEGTGIGLSLVKFFVEIHGGKISVDSEVGKGTIFTIELPSRIIKENEVAITTDRIKAIKHLDNKIEMINIEFSDIYSI